jgi:predicted ester cyclase
MSIEVNKKLARKYYFQPAKSPDTSDGAPKLRFSDHSPMENLRAAFPDIAAIALEQTAEGDVVVNRTRYFATHVGEYLGIAPTGRRVTFAGVDWMRFDGDKVVERWGVADEGDLRRQLLGLPDPQRNETIKRLAREYYLVADRDGPAACKPFIGDHSAYHSANHTGFDEGIVPMSRAKLFYTAFPDFTHTLIEQMADNDVVFQRVIYSATHMGLFMGVPASGRKIRFTGMDWIRFEGCTAVERWGVGYELSLRHQLQGQLENPYSAIDGA